VKVGKRTAKLIREAAVLGFVNGAFWAGYNHRDPSIYPKDSAVLDQVLRSAQSNSDLYPTLSRAEMPAPASQEGGKQ
jgi:hypothetical protein